jgi:hypothetical protein
VLRAALKESDGVRRWVPWLCAYSGARLSEVCQLRAEDVVQVDGVWCLKLDPEAGSLKTRSSERAIPLHRAVIDSGFLGFVQSVGWARFLRVSLPTRLATAAGMGRRCWAAGCARSAWRIPGCRPATPGGIG